MHKCLECTVGEVHHFLYHLSKIDKICEPSFFPDNQKKPRAAGRFDYILFQHVI